MHPSTVKARLLAASLLICSSCGTLAIFGVVPLMAHLLSPKAPPVQQQSEVFPQIDRQTDADRSLANTASQQQRHLMLPTASTRLQPNRSAL